MPWHIGSSADCPDSKPFAVIKDSDGTIEGCHPTKAAAQKQLAALYANEPGVNSMVAHLKHEDLAAVPPARLPFPVTRAVGAAPDTTRSDGEMPTMSGHFSTFNDWYEVDSYIEGNFLEQIAPGAFRKTIRKSNEDRGAMKVLYDHGQDPQIGNKVLGPIAKLEEDRIGPAYAVPLLPTSYNRDLVPGLLAGLYGSSFRFTVEGDNWDNSPEPSDYNPAGIPERTITEARVYEFGPVTFPANPNATAGARSTTDVFYQRSRDPEAFESLLRSAQVARTLADAGAAAPASEPPQPDTPPEEPPGSDTPPEPPPDPPAPAPEGPPESGSSDTPRSAPVDLTTIEDKRARVSELNEALERQATAYPGVLPEDEQTSWDKDMAERDVLNADIAAWDSRQSMLVDRAAKPSNVERTFEPSTQKAIVRKPDADIYSFDGSFRNIEERNQVWRDDAMRATEITTFPNVNTDVERSKDRIANLLDYHDSDDKELARRIKATGSPVYKRAFEKILRGGKDYLTPEEQRGTALAVGVDATGGFAVPFAFDPTVIAIGVHGGAINPYRRVCRVVPIVGTDTWNALTATAVVATRTTEAAPAIEQGPTFAQPQYIVKRVQAQITYSLEMGQDRPDLSSEMAALIQEAKDNEEETSFATGAGGGSASIGVGPVNGTSGAYTGITTATSVTLAAADFDATEAALPARHRFNAQWFFNRLNIRKAQGLETTGGKLFGGSQYPAVGNPMVEAAGNTGLRLLMYPVNESPSLPTAGTALITIGTLLNPDSYVIVDRIGMSIQLIPFIFGASQGNLVTGQQAVFAMWRNTAAPLNVDAGRTLRYLT
jgi:HK97 family phage major capsid protein/HK97 family phage prohead protease